MLKILFISIGLLVLVCGLGFSWLVYRTKAGASRLRKANAERVRPVTAALERGEAPDASEVARLAADPTTRITLYRALAELGHVELFPDEFTSDEKFAEAALVSWLSHPNELNAPPDVIELVEEVLGTRVGRNEGTYYVFRFRTNPPHWASKKGWMIGIAGPYSDDETADYNPNHTGSRLDPYDPANIEGLVRRILGEASSVAVVSTSSSN